MTAVYMIMLPDRCWDDMFSNTCNLAQASWDKASWDRLVGIG
jgi:hypothetical protein